MQKPLLKVELAALSTAASITAREQQVLRLVSAGLSNREIATQFSFAESTVKTHLKNIYRKHRRIYHLAIRPYRLTGCTVKYG